MSVSYPLHHSFKRLGIAYSFDRSSLIAVQQTLPSCCSRISTSAALPDRTPLNGIITSKITPSFSINTLDSYYAPHKGKSFFVGGEFAGIGGTVHVIPPHRPIQAVFPHATPPQRARLQRAGSFISGYGGIVAPPFERSYLGRRKRSARLRHPHRLSHRLPAQRPECALRNPDGSLVPANPHFSRVHRRQRILRQQLLEYPRSLQSAGDSRRRSQSARQLGISHHYRRPSRHCALCRYGH